MRSQLHKWLSGVAPCATGPDSQLQDRCTGARRTRRDTRCPCHRVLQVALRIALAAVALACAAALWAAEPKAAFYVVPEGNDQWTGTLPAPNADRRDGPFATIPRAQQAVRALKADRPGQPITVMLSGGSYYLSEPLVFTPQDSGTDRAPVSWVAAPGQQPVISGGVRLAGFQATAEGRWQVALPEVAAGNWTFCQLFVNGHRCYRPRLPKDSYYLVKEGPSRGDERFDHFTFKAGQIHSSWVNPGDVEVLVFNNWTDSRMRVKSVDAATRTVTFTGTSTFDMQRDRRFIVENAPEALSQPGEFYLDRKTGLLTYLPLPDEKLDSAVVVAPRLEKLVIMKGDGDLGQWVENLQFRGLTFAHTNWVLPPQGYSCGQGEVDVSAGIMASGARNCLFDGCIFKQTGGYAIHLGAGCANNRLEDCDLVDLGAGGVKIGEMGTDKAPAQGNIVRNCTIAHCGRLHPAGHGIWVGQSFGNRFEHNEIWDLYYSGFSLGWSWGYGATPVHDNTVEYNHVHQIGQQVLSDMGCIYTLGIQPGTVIRYNHFHDVDYYYYGGWGIYFDEGSTGILAENNLVYNTHGGCFHQHYGQSNRLLNNIWALDQSNILARTRPEDHLSVTFEHNIFYAKAVAMFGGNWAWTGRNYAFDYNLYWDAGHTPIEFVGLPLAKWQSDRGQDLHSLVADPMFLDPDHYDFRLKPGSPAEKIGFKPFDVSTAGRLTKPHDPLSTQTVPRAFPGPPPPGPVEDDFEDTPSVRSPRAARFPRRTTSLRSASRTRPPPPASTASSSPAARGRSTPSTRTCSTSRTSGRASSRAATTGGSSRGRRRTRNGACIRAAATSSARACGSRPRAG